MPDTFKEFIETRRKLLTGDAQERRLALIETEALEIAHRELANARTLARAFVSDDKISLDHLLQLQNLLAGLYSVAFHELVLRGEIERPVMTVPAGAPLSGTDNNKEEN